MPDRPRLLVFTGPPGTGKSTLADEAARLLCYPLFAKDQLEATLRRSGIGPDANSGWSAVELLNTLAREQLRRGQSAILDSVATFGRMRAMWRALAPAHGATLTVVECICSDKALHRTGIERRQRGIPGWPELSWDDVLAVQSRYEPWSEPRLILDAAQPLAANQATLRAYLLADR